MYTIYRDTIKHKKKSFQIGNMKQKNKSPYYYSALSDILGDFKDKSSKNKNILNIHNQNDGIVVY